MAFLTNTAPFAQITTTSVTANNTAFFTYDATTNGNKIKSIAFQLTSVGGGGTTSFQSSEDGTTWVALACFPKAGGASVTTTTAVGQWIMPVLGRYTRAQVTAFTSGTLTALAYGSEITLQPFGITTTVAGSGNFAVTMAASATGSPAKAEDAAHASADVGVFDLGVRVDDASAASPSASGDYTYQLVNRKGAQAIVNFEHQVRGYRAVTSAFTPYASTTDLIELFGNASTTVEVRRIAIHGIATSAAQDLIYIVKRSAANTGGTKSGLTSVPLDAVWAAASSTPQLYTVVPTGLGTAVGTIGGVYVPLLTNAGAGESGHEWTFGINGTPPLRLIGTSQGIALNRNGVAVPAGMSIIVEIEWIEYIA